jgi:hypothetical protein
VIERCRQARQRHRCHVRQIHRLSAGRSTTLKANSAGCVKVMSEVMSWTASGGALQVWFNLNTRPVSGEAKPAG